LVVSYPYDGTASGASIYSKAPDDAVFRALSLSYASSHQEIKKGDSCNHNGVFEGGITNGAAWYFFIFYHVRVASDF
jgi:hypothetical protein